MPNGERGFSYIGLLVFIAVTAAASAVVLGAGTAMQQRDDEAELLAIGNEFRAAFASYAAATPLGTPQEPKELADLLRDPRQPGVLRHLRRVHPDPLTGKTTWGIVRSPEGRIVGIHSLSRTPTFRRTGFPAGNETFEKSDRHDEWIFASSPPVR
jgi:type II secretory pathway pseudopilin PulG